MEVEKGDNDNYAEFVKAVKKRVQQAQYAALKAVNSELISLYWDLGRMIVEKQEQYGWGENVVKRLSKDLKVELEGMSGLSPQNLWRMRQFYLTYSETESEILSAMLREIGWSQHLEILKCKSSQEREFYLQMTKKYGWSYRTLNQQINQKTYEKWLLNQTNFEETVPEDRLVKALLAVKDDYNFDFVGLPFESSERELETALVANITKLLAEKGGYFTFVGRQFPVKVGEEEFFIDLLFYHRVLRSLIAVELKTGKFIPEYAGKMQFYLSALDDIVRVEGENPSVGIIICKDKDRTQVEYTLRDVNRPIGVASYNQYHLSNMPEILAKYLPSEEEITKRLGPLCEE
jgi:predicted nuclease of restriction endonuclease-like (RecB) superfamily